MFIREILSIREAVADDPPGSYRLRDGTLVTQQDIEQGDDAMNYRRVVPGRPEDLPHEPPMRYGNPEDPGHPDYMRRDILAAQGHALNPDATIYPRHDPRHASLRHAPVPRTTKIYRS